MESESFQDETVAEQLNESFVPIKVDREERPDLDRIYQTICQLVSGRGGWPLSAWLTPDGKPFYVGTYFPRESRQGMPGFLELLTDIDNSWRTDREEIENRARQWTDAVTDQLETTGGPPDERSEAGTRAGGGPGTGGIVDSSALGDAAAAAIRGADREYGGFGSSGPKFPHPGRIDLLLRTHANGVEGVSPIATETLDAMANGGMYDHIGGGFHRYATDRSWTVPHFEKMLYDNAELPRVYLGAVRAFGDARYARVACETLSFVDRELSHPEGGFYSTLDAQSRPPESRLAADEGGSDAGEETRGATDHDEKREGSFYVWTPGEVHDVVDDTTTADLVCDRFGIVSGGNFEHGTTVLTIEQSIASLAESFELSEDAVRDRLDDAREALFDARERRPRPARDEKVLAGWNGLMISAFSAGALTLDPKLADRAESALSFVREQLWDPDAGELSRRYKDGDVKGDGYLDDYAFLARGALDLYGVTGEVDQLAFAIELARTIEAEFWDPDAGTVYFTPESGERLVARPQELTDQSTPSSLGVATSLLSDLAHFTPEDEFGEIADTVLATHADRIQGNPLEHVSLLLAADKRDRGATELTLVGDGAPDQWRSELSELYLPAAILAPRPASEDELEAWLDRLGLSEAPPIWRGRDADGGEPTVYACAQFTCSPPKRSIRESLEWLGAAEAGEESTE